MIGIVGDALNVVKMLLEATAEKTIEEVVVDPLIYIQSVKRALICVRVRTLKP